MEYTCSSRRASHMSSQLMQISSMTVHRFKGNKPVNNGRSKPLRNHPQNHKRGASSCQFIPEIMPETVSHARGCQRITTYLKPPASTSLSLSLCLESIELNPARDSHRNKSTTVHPVQMENNWGREKQTQL